MVRPREYDEEEVLERAMLQFWGHGYDATSVADLMQATGLAKGSLYKGFGDKRQLFLRALSRYLERGRASLHRCLDSGESAHAGLQRWLDANIEPCAGGGLRRGCLAVNVAVERAPHDAEVRRILRSHERRMEALYQDCVRRGQADGSLRVDLDPSQAAHWITTVVYGLQVRAKLGMSHPQGQETTSHLLAELAPR